MRPARKHGRRIGFRVAAAVLLLVFLVFGAAQVLPSLKGGATHKCLVEGPNSPAAEISERSDLVTGHLTAWPLGRACEWDRADGLGTVTTYSGSWGWTLATIGVATLGLLSAALSSGRPFDRLRVLTP